MHDRKRAVADGSLLRRDASDRARAARTCSPHATPSSRTRSPSCSPASPSTAPTCPQGRRAPRPRARDGARAHRPDLAAVLDDLDPLLGDPGQPAALRFQQTSGMVMAKGVEDNAFYRCSRLSSLNEVGADPGIFALAPGQFHEAMAAPPARLAARDDHAVHPRHQARRGRAGPASPCWPSSPSAGPRRSTCCSSWPPLPDPGFATCCGRPRVGAWPIEHATGCTPTPRRRCARPATAPPGPTRTRRTRSPCTQRSTRPSTTHEAMRTGLDELAAGSQPAGAATPWPLKLLALTMPGVPDVYQGSERRGAQPGRPRQPPAGRLRRRAASLADGCGREAAGHPDGPAAAPGPAGAVHGLPAADRAPARWPTTCSPSTAAGRHRGDPAARRAAGTGGWGDTTIAAARGSVA